jgi:inorganic pyrophosphatase
MSSPHEPDLNHLLKLMFQAHPWHGVSAYAEGADLVHAFIEIVPSDPVKYELDKASGHLSVDRPQRFSSLPPVLYGFVPQTYCGARVGARCRERTGRAVTIGDGDPIDVCVLTEKTVSHGNFLARVEPIGGLRLIDGNQADDKIVAVLTSDLAYGEYHELSQIPKPLLDRLRHYFLTYKRRPGPDPGSSPVSTAMPLSTTVPVTIAETYDRAEALATIEQSVLDYRESFGAPEMRVELLKRLLSGGT